MDVNVRALFVKLMAGGPSTTVQLDGVATLRSECAIAIVTVEQARPVL